MVGETQLILKFKENQIGTGARTDMTTDAKYVYVYEKNVITKVSTGKK